MNIPWDQLFDFLLVLLEKCVKSGPDAKKQEIRSPGIGTKIAVRRGFRKKYPDQKLTDEQWDEVWGWCSKASDVELDIIVNGADWSMF